MSVTPVPLTPIPFSCLLNWLVQVCVLVNTGIRPVYVPPVANVNVSTLIPGDPWVAGVHVLPVKFKDLNQDPSVNVGC